MIKNSIRKRSGWRVVECANVANMIWSQFYKHSLDIRPQRRLKDFLKSKNREKSDIQN